MWSKPCRRQLAWHALCLVPCWGKNAPQQMGAKMLGDRVSTDVSPGSMFFLFMASFNSGDIGIVCGEKKMA